MGMVKSDKCIKIHYLQNIILITFYFFMFYNIFEASRNEECTIK